MIIADLKKGRSSLGADYGCVHPQCGGIVMDAATLPDGIYFHVENGHWWGYVTSKDGMKYIYTGVDPNDEDPTEQGTYVTKRAMQIEKGESYDVVVGELKVKQYSIEYRKRHKWVKFDILNNSLSDVNNALDVAAKSNTTILETFKSGVVDLIDSMAEGGKVNSELLKHNIEELYENITERTREHE